VSSTRPHLGGWTARLRERVAFLFHGPEHLGAVEVDLDPLRAASSCQAGSGWVGRTIIARSKGEEPPREGRR